jgi:hypothetical protein
MLSTGAIDFMEPGNRLREVGLRIEHRGKEHTDWPMGRGSDGHWCGTD